MLFLQALLLLQALELVRASRKNMLVLFLQALTAVFAGILSTELPAACLDPRVLQQLHGEHPQPAAAAAATPAHLRRLPRLQQLLQLLAVRHAAGNA